MRRSGQPGTDSPVRDALHPAIRVFLYLPALGLVAVALTFVLVPIWQLLALPIPLAVVIGVNDESLLVAHGVGLVAVILVTWLFRRYVDRQSLSSLGLQPGRGWLAEAVFGFGLGALLMGLIFIAELALGAYRVRGLAWEERSAESILATLCLTFLGFAFVAFSEELVARGYILQNLATAWGTRLGVLFSSLLFSLGHLLNPGAGPVSSLGLFSAGVLLAIAYIVLGRLWLPIGLHLSWNFFQGPVFGFPVSGLDTAGLLVLESTGPTVLTGGEFGPEASLIAVLVELLGIGLLVGWARGRPQREGETER
jgi:membrane protease YdiL (CAAX protease family)